MKKTLFLFALFSILIFCLFFNKSEKKLPNRTVMEEKFSREELISLVTQRITYERNNLRYSMQKEEYDRIDSDFQELREGFEIIIDGLGVTPDLSIEFYIGTDMGNFFDSSLGATRHLALYNRRVRFLNSDFSTFMRVQSDRRLLAALKSFHEEVEFATFQDGVATFTLNDEYFKEKERVAYSYCSKKSGESFVNGIPITDHWNFKIVGYNWYADSFQCNRYNVASVDPPGLYRHWWGSRDWVEDYDIMKKRAIITILITLSTACLVGAICVSRMMIPKKSVEIDENSSIKESSKFKMIIRKPELEYVDFYPYYKGQEQEFHRGLEVFYKYKESFEKIINETNKIGYEGDILYYYLLGTDWKKQLDYIPEGEFLKFYDEYFFVFRSESENADDREVDFIVHADETMQQRVSDNQQLRSVLNSLGESGEVMEIIFGREGVWFKLVGPFFKEEIMIHVGYIYHGKEETFIESCTEDMWLDEHWLIDAPYPARKEDYDPYEGIDY